MSSWKCADDHEALERDGDALMAGLVYWTPEQQAARATEIVATLICRVETPRHRLPSLDAIATLPRLVLFKLPADEAKYNAEAIVRQLDDASPLVRRAAFEAIARLLPGVLWQHVQSVIRRLQDVDNKVQQYALEALGSMPAEVIKQHIQLLARYIGLFIQRLSDEHGHVRFYAQRTLGKLPKQLVAAHAGAMANQIESTSAGARIALLSVLAMLSAVTLSSFVFKILAQLRHPAWGVRLAAIRALASLAPTELKEHALLLTRMMHDVHHEVRVEARNTLGKMFHSLREQQIKTMKTATRQPSQKKNKKGQATQRSIDDLPKPKRAKTSCEIVLDCSRSGYELAMNYK